MERKEAIKIILENWPDASFTQLREALETLIPELKESEDERTRREIVDFIRWAIDRGSITKEQRERSDTWLAYLEKQKVQKPAEGTALQKAFISSKINFTLEEKCDASDYAEVILPTSVAYGEDDEEYKLHKIIEAAFIAGQKKEQKPAEWSEKDNVQLNAAIQIVSNSGHYTTANWLKSLRPSWKPSEEQMEALSDAYAEASTFKMANILESLYNNLQKLL